MNSKKVILDANEAVAKIAYKLNEIIVIYPITPSSPMGELSDVWSSLDVKNIWGTTPHVIEMQSEGGAAGALHGALQSGSLTTTFTASQGLLLMIPNMYKIAGELTPAVFHVSARSIAVQALSIFGDHSDVMAVRQTGFAMLCSNSVQEAMDMALIAHRATLESRIPFVHFFDGFRTSHEVLKIDDIDDDVIRKMIDDKFILEHRKRALTPDNPFIRGTAQNPDVYFQGRESVNSFYNACPDIVQNSMDEFAKLTGREYKIFEYTGDPNAERVIIMMGSGAETAEETVEYLNASSDEKVGLLKVRLYRPFSSERLIQELPLSVKKIAVLDRTKEPGCSGEPLYLDVVNALHEFGSRFETLPSVIGGRYGLSSKEFTPAMVMGIFDELKKEIPKNHFTIGINDDVTNTSLKYDSMFSIESDSVFKAMFYGYGSDGTVGANKNTIKIIGDQTEFNAQGYFVYDSKKSGSTTISHLRFGIKPIKSTYLIQKSDFVACHQFNLLEKFDVLGNLKHGGTFLLNSPYTEDELCSHIPDKIIQQIIEKQLKVYVIDALSVARITGMGARINTIMQTCFFAISGVLPKDDAIKKIKDAVKKTYRLKGDEVVERNYKAIDLTLQNLRQVDTGILNTNGVNIPDVINDEAPAFVNNVVKKIIEGRGDEIKVSEMPVDGTFPSDTAKWEKRNIATEVPVWDNEICIQCGKCAIICPHSTIRIKAYDKKYLDNAPGTFKYMEAKGKDFEENMAYTIQVAVEDCTGCGLCFEICPVKNKKEVKLRALNMHEQKPLRFQERENWEFFLSLPEYDRTKAHTTTVKGSQLLQPLFEFSGACSGCGETPYVKLVSQLFGDRAMIANATGCSSIYGGNLPTTPWSKNNQGRGPAWSNSLFEDNAEFGLGMRLSVDKHYQFAIELLKKLEGDIGTELTEDIINADQSDEPGIHDQRTRVEKLKTILSNIDTPESRSLLAVSDYLVKKSVWIIGGDGWAYDIGFGGLDHVLSSGKNVNLLVLDTEVYSNTGGQMSKSTGIGAVAKFAAHGKSNPKKDLAKIAMSYGNVYVAKVAMGANDTHTLRAFLEAESFDGPSIIIAYSHCIAHGINMTKGLDSQKAAVDSGYWQLYRYDPRLIEEGKNPFRLDSKDPKIKFEDYAYKETRYKMLTKSSPARAKELLELAQMQVDKNWQEYKKLAEDKSEINQ